MSLLLRIRLPRALKGVGWAVATVLGTGEEVESVDWPNLELSEYEEPLLSCRELFRLPLPLPNCELGS
jgi:hypothetical protein